jgi:hypothetical protein
MLHTFTIRNGDPVIKSDPIGRCIYCAATQYSDDPARQLGEEHVVPEGLGGTLALRFAACARCEVAINIFEQPILKTILYAPRVYMGIRRKRRKRPQELFRLRGDINGKNVEFDLPIEEIPVLLLLLQLGPLVFYPVARLMKRICMEPGFSTCLAIGAYPVANTVSKPQCLQSSIRSSFVSSLQRLRTVMRRSFLATNSSHC